ncbi:hypothetical protein [Viridibacillus sp. FSL H7-0596]|uniref:hypothetical protein n=1 Tax=Viridibacillus sp. FSL H7-0596 TaxID=1928923 RepID=UPI001438E738|nr:hypothetical protein [Viridibacillus sp. FSL H7-0596]
MDLITVGMFLLMCGGASIMFGLTYVMYRSANDDEDCTISESIPTKHAPKPPMRKQ